MKVALGELVMNKTEDHFIIRKKQAYPPHIRYSLFRQIFYLGQILKS